MVTGVLESLGLAALETAMKVALKTLLSDDKKRGDSVERGADAARRMDMLQLISLSAAPASVRKSLAAHLDYIRRWSRILNVKGALHRKQFSKIFVEVDVYLVPLGDTVSSPISKSHESKANTPYRKPRSGMPTEPLLQALTNRAEHCVMLGQAGAGKTTAMQKICLDYSVKDKALLNHEFPIYIRLRELKGSTPPFGPILTQIAQIVGISTSIGRYLSEAERGIAADAILTAVCKYLDALNVVILLDGFDEILDDHIRNLALAELSLLSERLVKSRFILTSRTAEFPYLIPHTSRLEIAPLTQEQIEQFASHWFESSERASEFVQKVSSSPYADTAVRPLTIAHLCTVFERTRDIPEKPKSVYRRIIHLLLEDWDAQRQFQRRSRYADFDHDRKAEYLAAVAYAASAEYEQVRFDSTTLKAIHRQICDDFGLPAQHASMVVKEIESHSGLIIESGAQMYEFAHRSLQEYLAAEYIVRLPIEQIGSDKIPVLANELAVAVALASRPTIYLCSLILDHFASADLSPQFYKTFIARLNLERIDIVCTPTSAAVACYLFERTDDVRDLEMFRPMFPRLIYSALADNYRVSKFLSDAGSFKRNASAAHTLPATLRIPDYVEEYMNSKYAARNARDNLPVRAD